MVRCSRFLINPVVAELFFFSPRTFRPRPTAALKTINYARENVIDFTKPFMNLGIGILFKVSAAFVYLPASTQSLFSSEMRWRVWSGASCKMGKFKLNWNYFYKRDDLASATCERASYFTLKTNIQIAQSSFALPRLGSRSLFTLLSSSFFPSSRYHLTFTHLSFANPRKQVPTSQPTRLFSFMNPLAIEIWLYVLAAYTLGNIRCNFNAAVYTGRVRD